MEAAPRFSAHAAQQRSCISLAPRIGWRSLAYGGFTIRAGIMRWLHECRVSLLVAAADSIQHLTSHHPDPLERQCQTHLLRELVVVSKELFKELLPAP